MNSATSLGLDIFAPHDARDSAVGLFYFVRRPFGMRHVEYRDTHRNLEFENDRRYGTFGRNAHRVFLFGAGRRLARPNSDVSKGKRWNQNSQSNEG